jgi:predicted aldo/keto reductase-like oxidoreductase
MTTPDPTHQIKLDFDLYVSHIKTHLSPIENRILSNLKSMYPDLDDETSMDWMYEILDCTTHSEIDSIFSHLNDMNSFSC